MSQSAPTYYSAPGVHPSDIYARPESREPGEFHFTDDATIAPDDSVSQLDRRFTGRRLMNGPRPMDQQQQQQQQSSAPPAFASIPESLHDETLLHQYVPPEMLLDDRTTVVPPRHTSPLAAPTAMPPRLSPGPSTAAPAPVAYRSMTSTPTPSAPPVQAYMQQHQYVAEEDDEDRDRAHAPLFAADGTAQPAAMYSRAGSGVAAYQSAVSKSGYGRLGGGEDEEARFGPHDGVERGHEHELHDSIRTVDGKANDGSAGGSRWVNPLGYLRSGGTHDDRDDKSAYEMHSKSASRSSLPSLNVVDRQDDYYGRKDDGDSKWKRMLWDSRPTEVRVEEHKRGQGIQRWPYASWGLVAIYTIVLVVEVVKNAQITGSPIQTKPAFNVMIGPSGAVLINQGARFAGCMKYIPGLTDIDWVCLSESNKAVTDIQNATCTMSEVCGFGGFSSPQEANQAFRFVLPIFLHAGVVHLLLNGLAQVFSSAMVERQMGTPKFLVVYFAAGIFGNILGANFALVGQPSVGASGAIFGTHAALLIDLLSHWKIEYRPVRKFVGLVIEIIVGLAIGLVPGIDNFAHLGGFLVGLLGATLLFPIIHQTKRHRLIFIGLRVIALPLVIVLFVVLTRNFYTSDPSTACSWCRYLSCWPTASNNHCKGTGLSTYTSSSGAFGTFMSIFVASFVLPSL